MNLQQKIGYYYESITESCDKDVQTCVVHDDIQILSDEYLKLMCLVTKTEEYLKMAVATRYPFINDFPVESFRKEVSVLIPLEQPYVVHHVNINDVCH